MATIDFGHGFAATIDETDAISKDDFVMIDDNIFRVGNKIAIVNNNKALIVNI